MSTSVPDYYHLDDDSGQTCSAKPGAIRWLETKSKRFGGLAARDKNPTWLEP